jgi:hypothetical protein
VRRVIACLLVSLAGCGSCGGGTDALRVEEPFPHVRCLAADPPAPDRGGTLGDVTVRIEERVATVEGPEAPVRFAAFTGPAPGRADLGEALAQVREAGVSFVIVVGDFGDDADALSATLRALGDLEVPVFLVPGGRDDAELFEDGLEAAESWGLSIDASGLDRIVVAGQSLVPIAGAPGGRYSRTDDACGFRASDLEARAERLGEPEEGERRYVVAWAAPTGGIARGIAGADAGSPALAEFIEAIAASGGLYAWPREAAGRVVGQTPERSEVLRRVAGPVALRDDGARPPVGPAFFSLGPDGLTSP